MKPDEIPDIGFSENVLRGCRMLAADLPDPPEDFSHGFLLDCPDRGELSKIVGSLGLDGIAQVTQVHGDRVIRWEDSYSGGQQDCRPEADGVVSGVPRLAVSVVTADCAPVIIFSASVDESGKRRVAAIHAGWRGLYSSIVKKGAEKTAEACFDQIFAIIGPAAGSCCYEISADLAKLFSERWPDVVDCRTGVFFLDLKLLAILQLKGAGVLPNNIYISHHCTICGGEKFPSYRREGAKAGRMVTFAGFIS